VCALGLAAMPALTRVQSVSGSDPPYIVRDGT